MSLSIGLFTVTKYTFYMSKLVTRTELSKALGISRKQVDIHRQHGRIQEASKNGRNPLFDLDVCEKAYREYKENVTQKRTGGVNKLTAQLRKAKADLEESELKLARLREEIVPADELEQTWEANRRACLERIRKFPAEIAPALVSGDDIAIAADTLEQAMRQLLTDLAKMDNEEDCNDAEEGE
jgi:terminase small subunit / prophage DNA-packing protein